MYLDAYLYVCIFVCLYVTCCQLNIKCLIELNIQMIGGKKLHKTQMPGDSANAKRGAVARHAYYLHTYVSMYYVLCYFISFHLTFFHLFILFL